VLPPLGPLARHADHYLGIDGLTCALGAESSRSPTCATGETIDSELRLLAAVRRVCREHSGVLPSIGPVDELLDERSQR
jgi:hypothetical protein